MSQYKSSKRDNEIIIPAYAADLSYGQPLVYRNKQYKPVVGFCGWGRLNNLSSKISFYIKNLFILRGPCRQGLYFRKMAIDILNKSSTIKTNFMIRSSYSANEKTIELNAQKAREEYKNNMIDSDFILAPKGDGNYSVRFFEALSLGRVPVLIDTDCPLPLENKIDYSKFVLRVSYRDISKLDKIISDFYKNLSEEEWLSMQKEARNTFDQYLRIDVFFRYIFNYENSLLS
jgi:hypothetical protein